MQERFDAFKPASGQIEVYKIINICLLVVLTMPISGYLLGFPSVSHRPSGVLFFDSLSFKNMHLF